jgi:hypothetical protein
MTVCAATKLTFLFGITKHWNKFSVWLQPINSMEQSPWEANSFSASQEIPRILRNLDVHYHIRMSLPPVPVLSQINPVYTLYPTSWRSVLLLFFLLCLDFQVITYAWVSPPKPCMHLACTCYMPLTSHSWFDHPNNVLWWVQTMELLLTQAITKKRIINITVWQCNHFSDKTLDVGNANKRMNMYCIKSYSYLPAPQFPKII